LTTVHQSKRDVIIGCYTATQGAYEIRKEWREHEGIEFQEEEKLPLGGSKEYTWDEESLLSDVYLFWLAPSIHYSLTDSELGVATDTTLAHQIRR
jgi:hypothetical protein